MEKPYDSLRHAMVDHPEWEDESEINELTSLGVPVGPVSGSSTFEGAGSVAVSQDAAAPSETGDLATSSSSSASGASGVADGASSSAPVGVASAASGAPNVTVRPKRTVKPVVDKYVAANSRSISRVLEKDRIKDMVAELADWKEAFKGKEEQYGHQYWVPLTTADSFATVLHEYNRMGLLYGVFTHEDHESMSTSHSTDDEFDEGEEEDEEDEEEDEDDEEEDEEDEEDEEEESEDEEEEEEAEDTSSDELSEPALKRLRRVGGK